MSKHHINAYMSPYYTGIRQDRRISYNPITALHGKSIDEKTANIMRGSHSRCCEDYWLLESFPVLLPHYTASHPRRQQSTYRNYTHLWARSLLLPLLRQPFHPTTAAWYEMAMLNRVTTTCIREVWGTEQYDDRTWHGLLDPGVTRGQRFALRSLNISLHRRDRNILHCVTAFRWRKETIRVLINL
jgi:hypothetical protein